VGACPDPTGPWDEGTRAFAAEGGHGVAAMYGHLELLLQWARSQGAQE